MSENKTQPEIIKDIIENDDNMAAIDDMVEEEIEQEETADKSESEQVESSNTGEVEGKVEGDVEGDVEGKVEDKVEDEVEGKVEGDVEGDVEGKVEDKVEDEVEDKVEGKVEVEDDTPEVIPNKPAIQNATIVDVGPKAITSSLQEDVTDDDSDDENEEVYQKLDKFKNKELLLNYHPETKQLKYADVMALTSITRDSENNIIDPMHKTIPILTRYERARVLGVRAKQLEHNAIPMIDIPANMIDSYLIAFEELKQKKIPFIIKRPMPDGTSEYWKLEDLEIVEY